MTGPDSTNPEYLGQIEWTSPSETHLAMYKEMKTPLQGVFMITMP